MSAVYYRRVGLVVAVAVREVAGGLLAGVDEVDGILRRTERDITSHLPRRQLGHRELEVEDFGENRCEYFGQQNCDLWGLNLPLWLIVIIVVGAVCLFFLTIVCIKFKVFFCI